MKIWCHVKQMMVLRPSKFQAFIYSFQNANTFISFMFNSFWTPKLHLSYKDDNLCSRMVVYGLNVTFHKCFMGGATNLDAPQVVPMPWGKNACDQSVESSEHDNQRIPQELQLQRKSLFLVAVLQVCYIDVVSTGGILVNAVKNDIDTPQYVILFQLSETSRFCIKFGTYIKCYAIQFCTIYCPRTLFVFISQFVPFVLRVQQQQIILNFAIYRCWFLIGWEMMY